MALVGWSEADSIKTVFLASGVSVLGPTPEGMCSEQLVSASLVSRLHSA